MAVPLTTPPVLTAKDVERFWSKVDRSDPDGCWPWMSGSFRNGYGMFCIQISPDRTRTLKAHRVALFIVTGEWPPVGMHGCDNPPCCRVDPGHVKPGTFQDNSNDMVRKGRAPTGERNGAYTHPESIPRGANHWAVKDPSRANRGEKHGRALITEDDVRWARTAVAAGERQWRVAEILGIGKTTLGHLIHRRNWKHVD